MHLINQSLKDKEYHPNLLETNICRDRSTTLFIVSNFFNNKNKFSHQLLPKRRHSYLGGELFTNSISPESANLVGLEEAITSKKKMRENNRRERNEEDKIFDV